MIDFNFLKIFEFMVLPFILVFGNFFIKYLIKENSRFDIKEFLAIGIDVVFMCIVGIAIFGISVYRHNNNLQANGFVISILLSVIILPCNYC